MTNYVGLAIVLAALLAYSLAVLLKNKLRITDFFRGKGKNQMLRSEIANSLETNHAIHLNTGSDGDSDGLNAAALIAVSSVKAVSYQMAYADEPWKITGNSGIAAELEKDAARSGLEQADYGSDFDPDCTVLTGFTPLTHQAAVLPVLDRSKASLHLNIGSFGPEVALSDLAFGADEKIAAAGENPLSQAVGVLTADEVCIGEELYEIPRSLGTEDGAAPSLMAMDWLRYGLAIFVIAGVVFGLFYG